MNEAIDELVRIAGDALRPSASGSGALPAQASDGILAGLVRLLDRKNGFYAFEGALHVFAFSAERDGPEVDGRRWNEPGLWINDYRGMADGCLFFAEDVFGGQFAARDGEVVRFDPETGEVEPLAKDVDAWAAIVLDDRDYQTGWSLAWEWRIAHGPLSRSSRLLPCMPFVLGGGYEVGNLHASEAVAGMKARANIAVQIRDLPDGTPIELEIVD